MIKETIEVFILHSEANEIEYDMPWVPSGF